ncbi:MAG: cbb3-type cytochrome c oxidase N-terminal domain-containing protein [Planctomycetota bacterium]
MAHEPQLLEHEYDGIREYDNPTPGWWHALFFLFVGFGAFYMFVSVASPWYSSPREGHEAAKLAWVKSLFGDLGDLEADEATIVRYYEDDSEEYAGRWMPYAASLFRANCVSCHGGMGEGVVGPNLTDEVAINVSGVTDIHDILMNGANAGAMPAWGNRFHPNEIVLLSSYVASLRGRDVPGRAAEGEPMPAWPTLAELSSGAEPASGPENGAE